MGIFINGKERDHFYLNGHKFKEEPVEIGLTISIPYGTYLYISINPEGSYYTLANTTATIEDVVYGSAFDYYKISKPALSDGSHYYSSGWVRSTSVTISG